LKPRLLFIKHKDFNARTVDNDISILKQKYNVKLYNVKIGRNLTFISGFLKMFLYLIFNIYRFKVIYIWFGDYHSYLPALFAKIFNKKCILCLGGYDAHWIIPGKARSIKEKFRKFCVIKSVKYATYVLPVSNWLAEFVCDVAEKNKIKVAYCCINPEVFEIEKDINKIDLKSKKENIVLTVGGGGILYETKRKKIDYFIEVANHFNKNYPEYNARFIVIGHNENTVTYDYLKKFIKEKNIEILPEINDPEILRKYFQKAKVYCQFSEYEAFGIAVIEAMLSDTIPIVYNGGAMPEVVGDAGIVINEYNVEKTAELIRQVFDGTYEHLRKKCRNRVLDNFTIENRKKILFKLI
jgi:glycosyltransferase involved in cell wall biosynthesis